MDPQKPDEASADYGRGSGGGAEGRVDRLLAARGPFAPRTDGRRANGTVLPGVALNPLGKPLGLRNGSQDTTPEARALLKSNTLLAVQRLIRVLHRPRTCPTCQDLVPDMDTIREVLDRTGIARGMQVEVSAKPPDTRWMTALTDAELDQLNALIAAGESRLHLDTLTPMEMFVASVSEPAAPPVLDIPAITAPTHERYEPPPEPHSGHEPEEWDPDCPDCEKEPV